MRISELRSYDQRDVRQAPRAREVAADYVPAAAATNALTRRSYANGLAMTETRTRAPERTSLGGLGELVQVVF